MKTDLGPMGTATAESLRAVGLEPDDSPPPRPRNPYRPSAPDLDFAWLPGVGRALAVGVVTVGLYILGCIGYQRLVDEPRRAVRELAGAVERAEDRAERRAMVADERERELLAAVRRVEEAQDRAVRADRRARRLNHNKKR